MLNEYKLKGATKKIEIEVEAKVAEQLSKMEKFVKISQSELANTALKRFISSHNDFFPKSDPASKKS